MSLTTLHVHRVTLPQGKPAQQSKYPRAEIRWSPGGNKEDKVLKCENEVQTQ